LKNLFFSPNKLFYTEKISKFYQIYFLNFYAKRWKSNSKFYTVTENFFDSIFITVPGPLKSVIKLRFQSATAKGYGFYGSGSGYATHL